MKRYAEFEKFNPKRRPDWRWERVRQLVDRIPSPGRCSPRDDAWVRAARRFILRWRKSDEEAREKIYCDNPGLVYAYQMFERHHGAPTTVVTFMEARLLARQSFEFIANEMSTLPATVRWYEALFFNVVDYLDKRDWIISTVVAPPIFNQLAGKTAADAPDSRTPETAAQRRRRLDGAISVALPFDDASLKYFSYFGGPNVVDLLIHGIQSGKPLTSPDDLLSWLDRTCSMIVRRRSLQAAGFGEITKFNAMELLATHARIMETEKGDDAQENRRTTLERHVKALLDDLPWRVGPHPGVQDSARDQYYGNAGELRDDELLAEEVTVPVEELQIQLPPPRPREGQLPASRSHFDSV